MSDKHSVSATPAVSASVQEAAAPGSSGFVRTDSASRVQARLATRSAGKRGAALANDAQLPLPDALFDAAIPAAPVVQVSATDSFARKRRLADDPDDSQEVLDLDSIEASAQVSAYVPVVQEPLLVAQAAQTSGGVTSASTSGAAGAEAASAATVVSAPVLGALVIGGGLLLSSKSSDSPQAIAPTPDTTAPKLVSTAVSGTASTVTLTFDSALKANAAPPRTAFKVSINGGADVEPTGVVVSGEKITLEFAAGSIPQGNIQFKLTYTDPAGVTPLTIKDDAGNETSSFTIEQGIVADGYIRGAQIYVDVNNNGVADASEKIEGVVTDALGRFFLPSTAPKGPIIAVGGVNIDTGLPNTTPLKAPAGSSTVNPLTTLVQAVIEKSGTANPDAAAITEAANKVAATLGLPESVATGGNLLKFDPMAAETSGNAATQAAAREVQKAAAKIATVIALAETSDASAASKVVSNLATSIQDAGGQTLNLADGSVLNGALKGVSVSLETRVAAADAVSAINAIKADTGNIGQISTIQSQTLDRKAPEAPKVEVSARTNDSTPTVKVRFNTTSTDGSAVVEGDAIRVFEEGVQIGVSSVLAADLVAGYKDISVSVLGEGGHKITAQLVDKSGNVSALSTAADTVVDLTRPSATISNSVASMQPGGKSTLTVVLSEAVEGFTRDDILKPEGSTLGVLSAPTVSSTGQVIYTIDFTAPPSNGPIQLSVGTGFTDLAGNEPGASSAPVDLSVDARPSAAIVDGTVGVATGPVVYTVSFSEVVTGFALDDLNITGGTAGALTTVLAGKVFSFAVTPNANATSISVQLKADAVEDSSKQKNLEQAPIVQEVDVQAPSVTVDTTLFGDNKISAAEFKTILDTTDGIDVLVTGSSEVGARVSLQIGANNTRQVIADSTTGRWEYALTAADIKAMGQGGETIVARATDAVGNTTPDASAARRDISIGTVAPTLTAWSLTDASDTGVKGDGRTNSATPSVSFAATAGQSVSVQVLGANDAVVQTKSVVGTGGDQSVTLDSLVDGSYKVRLTAADAGGNSVERVGQLVVDTVSPGASASDTTSASLIGRSAGNVVFQFVASEPSVGLTSDEVTIVGGKAAGAVKLVAPSTFELAVTPDADLEGETGKVTVSIAAAKFTDLTGNPNTAVVAHTQAVDTRGPRVGTLPTATIDENNTSQTFAFTATDLTAITWALKQGVGDAAAFSIDAATGVAKLIAAPNFEAKSAYSAVIQAVDAVGNATDIPFALTVRNLDEVAPTITSSGAGSIAENAALSAVAYKATSTDTGDISSGNTAYSLKEGGGDASLFNINATTGDVTLKAAANFEEKSSYSFTVVATDTAGNASEKPVTIAVTDVNEDPVKTASVPTAPLIVVVDQPLQGASVAGWFSDPDGSATPFGKLTYSVSPALPTGLQLNRDTGVVTGTIGSMPDMQLTFTATDGAGRSVSHTVTAKTVSAPVISGFSVSDSVGSPTAGKAGDSLSFTVNLTEPVTVTGTPLLKFVTDSGSEVSATYSADGSSGAALKFTATAPSGDGALKLAAVNLNGGSVTGDVSKQGLVVASVDQTFAGYRVDNTAPVVPSAGRTFGVNENSLAVGQIPATDATPVSFVLGSGGDAALFTLSSSGALAFQAAKDFEANPVARTFSISVIPTDAAGNAGAAVPITVNLQDQDEFDVSVPVDSNQATNTVAENSSVGTLVGVTASASDQDGTNNTVSYSLVTATGAAYTGSEFAINPATGVVSVAGPINFEASGGGSRQIYVKAASSDGSTATTANPITVAITDVNEAPAAVGVVGAQTAVNGQAFSLALASKFADPDTAVPFNTVTYAITSGSLPAGLSLNSTTGLITGTASANASPVNLTVTATDGGQLTGTQSFSLQVVSAPVLQSFTVSDSVGSEAAGKSGDALTFRVQFTEAVNVVGTPKIFFNVVNNGQVASSVEATYSSGTGSETLVFTGTAPNASGTLAVQSILLSSGASIIGNITGQGLVTSTVGQTNTNYTLDSTAPSITAPSGTAVSVPESSLKVADLASSEPVVWTISGSGFALGSAASSSANILNFSALKNFEVTADRTSTVTVTATDAAGNSASKLITVNVTDVDEFDVAFNSTNDSNTATNTVAENAASGTLVGITASAADADGSTNGITYSLVANAQGTTPYTGTEFSIDASTGVVTTGTTSLDFESLPADGKTKTLYVKAQSQDMSTQVATYTVAVTDANDKPQVVTGSPTEYVAVVGQALPATASIKDWFSDQDLSTTPNGTLTYSATPSLSTLGLTLNATTGAVSGTATTSGTQQVTFRATDGGGAFIDKVVTLKAVNAPTLAGTSALDGVTNLDPTSNIVLKFTEEVSITSADNKFIRIVNDANSSSFAGFRGENTTNSLQIGMKSGQVTVLADKKTVVINPAADLDLGNNFHIEIDEGAFVGVASGQGNPALSDPTVINFSTVVPKSPTSLSAPVATDGAASQIMAIDGTLAASRLWLDIENLGSPSASSKVSLNVGSSSVALIAKDYDPTGPTLDGYDGIKTADIFLSVIDFSADDLLYVDNQSAVANSLETTNISNAGAAPTTIQFAGTGLGGILDITVAGSTAAFDTVASFKTLLQMASAASSPVISA